MTTKFKLAELGEINSASDAMERIQDWLAQYEAERGGRYQIPSVDIMKEGDGWYATLPKPPQPIA